MNQPRQQAVLGPQVHKVLAIAWALPSPDEGPGAPAGLDAVQAHLVQEDASADKLLQMHALALDIVRLRNSACEDAVEQAAMRSFGSSGSETGPEAARRALELVEQFARLNATAKFEPSKRGRGRPPSRSILLQAVVRAAMHQLAIDGKPISGGWFSVRATRKEGEEHRTKDSEYTLSGAAAYVVDQVKAASIAGDLAEIDGHMTEYVRYLDKRSPEERDYYEIT